MPDIEVQQGFIPAPAALRRHHSDAAPEREGPLGLGVSVLVILGSAAGLALTAVGALQHDLSAWQALLLFAALAVAAERSDLSVYGDSRVSLAFVPIFASVIVAGMTGLAIVVAAAVLASATKRPFYKTGFNWGALMVAGAAAASVFDVFSVTPDSRRWPALLGVSALAGAVNFLTNSALVSTAIAWSGRSSVRRVWSEHFFWLWPHYIVLAATALAMVAAYELMGLWGIGVFLVPPLMMRLSMKQYLDRTARSVHELRRAHSNLQNAHEQLTSAMSSLHSAYDGTLRSLVAALDARDAETAGHSERVAELTIAIAAEMGIEEGGEEWRHIAWGALLHDVGKIAISDDILRKPGTLTDGEWDVMRTHPGTGFEILRSVDFLAPAGEIVLSHHERFDGLGYPHGLARDEIPLGARIFAIADSFDAMTSDRTYRRAMPPEEALAEILRGSGTQFDPAAVAAFLAVYRRRFVRNPSSEPELFQSVKRAIMEAAGLERRP